MRIWFLVMMGLWLAGPAQAQNSSDFFCPDYYSRAVQWVDSNSELASLEAGYKPNGVPIIRINSGALSGMGLSAEAQKFARFHECAHHVLGHVVSPTADVREFDQQVSQADCWAANRFYYYSDDGKQKLDRIQEEINNLSRKNWIRYPGPVRVIDFEQSCHFR